MNGRNEKLQAAEAVHEAAKKRAKDAVRLATSTRHFDLALHRRASCHRPSPDAALHCMILKLLRLNVQLFRHFQKPSCFGPLYRRRLHATTSTLRGIR